MIYWLTGNTGAGKTTLANLIKKGNKNVVILDGDELRKCWDLGFSREDREEQNLRAAHLANLLERQGFDVVVAVICPYRHLRREIFNLTDCRFVYLLDGKEATNDKPYELPKADPNGGIW